MIRLTDTERQAVDQAAAMYGPVNGDLITLIEAIAEKHARTPAERGEWPPMPLIGDYVQTNDGGIWLHVEWGQFYSGTGYKVDWNQIGARVIAHGTIHWRDAFGGVDD